jgi:hypothetical protein
MKSIVTVTEPAANYNLTTRTRVLAELKRTGETRADDNLLDQQIADASAAIARYCNRVLLSEGVEEIFWPDPNALNHRGGGWWGANFWSWRGFAGQEIEIVRLDRYPVSSVYSVTLDGDLVDPSEYRLDPLAGLLYRLDPAGYPWTWFVAQSVVVDYTGGYAAGQIPADLDRGARLFVVDAWSGADKDPRVKSENLFGVAATSYVVGRTGDLPADVETLVSPYRRQPFA